MSARRSLLPVLGLLTGTLILGAASCGPDGPRREGDPSLDARIRVSPTPAVQHGSRITVQVTSNGAPYAEARVRLRGEPTERSGPSAASPSVPVQTVTATEPAGTYGPLVTDFPVVGDWWIVIEVDTPDGRSATLRHPLLVVGAPD